MWIVILGLIFATFIIIGRLVAFQIIQGKEWAARTSDELVVIARPERGTIYDRNGAVLAANGADYQIGASPNLIVDAEEMASQLAVILEEPRRQILADLEADTPFVMLSAASPPTSPNEFAPSTTNTAVCKSIRCPGVFIRRVN